MRGRTTLLLALIFLALGAFYYFFEIKGGPKREEAAAKKDRLWTVEAKDVEEIILRRGSETVRLRREGDGWRLTQPVQARGDRAAADSLASTLANVRMDREIDPNPAKLADFGLERPQVEAEITVKGQAEPLGLLLGDKNPTGTFVFAKKPSSAAVVAVSDFVLTDLKKSVADLRDKTLFALERKDVQAIEVKKKGLHLKGEAGKENDWSLLSPLKAKADWERISTLMDKIRSTKIKEFVTDGKSPATYGLDSPIQVTLWVGREKDRAERTLLLGKVEAAKKAVYAKRQGEDEVFLLDEDLLKAVPQTAFDLRDKSVFTYDPSKVEKIHLASSKGLVTLIKEGDAWQIKAPIQAKADESVMGNLLWRLKETKAKAFAAEEAKNLAVFGLNKPAVRVELWEKDAKTPKTFLLAPAKGGAYGSSLEGGPVALVEAKLLDDLSKGAFDLRDKSLFSFEAKDVQRLRLRIGADQVSLERKGDDWRLVEPKSGQARASKANDILFTVRNLKYAAIISERGEEPAKYGLDTPAIVITLAKADGGELGVLQLGKREGNRTYVRTNASPTIYAVETKSLGGLPKGTGDLLQ